MPCRRILQPPSSRTHDQKEAPTSFRFRPIQLRLLIEFRFRSLNRTEASFFQPIIFREFLIQVRRNIFGPKHGRLHGKVQERRDGRQEEEVRRRDAEVQAVPTGQGDPQVRNQPQAGLNGF